MSATNPVARMSNPAGYVPVNGLEMYYEIHGGGSPLVLLHGAMGTIDSCFAGLLPALAAARQVIAVELQGHGHTADVDRPLSAPHGTPQSERRVLCRAVAGVQGGSRSERQGWTRLAGRDGAPLADVTPGRGTPCALAPG